MNRKKLFNLSKIIISFPLSIALLCANYVSLSVSAASISRTIDNDPIASGYSYDAYNMSYYNGMTGSYNQDMRLSPSIYGSNAYYRWIYPTMNVASQTCNVTLNIYLNHADFTDESATYYFEKKPIEDLSGVVDKIGTKNQKYAPAGWSSISKSVTRYPGETYITSRLVSVNASSGSYKQLGADALQVTVTY